LPNHATLFVELMERLRPGGVFALQMPHNLNEPSHQLMREVRGPWTHRIEQLPLRTSVLSPREYYDSLAPHAQSIDIWQTIYEHVLPDAKAIVEWVKGTGLRPYLEALTDDGERSQYLKTYTEAIDIAYPPRVDGKRLFSFPRLFLVAVR
jgi:trans-aconitate 2-methyltransferase